MRSNRISRADDRGRASVRERAVARRAFTLVELIVVILILAIVATVAVPRLLSRVGDSKQSVATSSAANLATAFRGMMADAGWSRVPDSVTIDALWERPGEATGWKGPYVENADALIDPWGRKFILVVPGVRNVDFDIVSYGADGTPGGTDENADIVKP
ncbi:MAG: type II secretion system protein GspG [Phycisphaeraceae bacterium]|nr:type II secretion system protein GspG [Phycisphaeraceae bacterium]